MSSAWSCIDGMDQAEWEYVPLGITADLKQIADAFSSLFPPLTIDDTNWTAAISGPRSGGASQSKHTELRGKAA